MGGFNNPTIDALAANLDHVWTLDETSGNRADSAGSTTLTDYNTTGYQAGKDGNAADFEKGNNERLESSSGADLTRNKTVIIVSMWVQFESTNAVGFLSYEEDDASNWRWCVYRDTAAKLRIYYYDGTSRNATSSNTVSTSTWYHITAMADSTNNELRIRVNGTDYINDTGQTFGASVDTQSSRGFTLGDIAGHTSNYDHDGLMDEVYLWTGAAPANFANFADALYNSGNGVFYDPDFEPSEGAQFGAFHHQMFATPYQQGMWR